MRGHFIYVRYLGRQWGIFRTKDGPGIGISLGRHTFALYRPW